MKNTKKIASPFVPFTEDKAREWFKKKRITPTGYLLIIRDLTTPPNRDFIIPSVVKFCKHWGFPKASFYRAIESLKGEGECYWEPTHGIVLKPFGQVLKLSQVETTVSSKDSESQPESDSLNLSLTVSNKDTQSQPESETYIRNAHAKIYSDLNSDLNQIPPTPQGAEEECAGDEHSGKTQEEESLPKSSSLDKTENELDRRNDNPGEDKYSAPSPCDNSAIDTRGGAYRMEQRFRQPRYPAYRTGTGRNDIKPEFLEYLQTKHLPTVSHYAGREITLAHAKGWVFNKEAVGQQELVEAHYEDMLALAAKKPCTPPQPSFAPPPEVKRYIPSDEQREAIRQQLLAKKAEIDACTRRTRK